MMHVGRESAAGKGLRPFTRLSMTVSDKQAQGRGIRAHARAAIRVGGEQGMRGSLITARKQVSRPVVFLERIETMTTAAATGKTPRRSSSADQPAFCPVRRVGLAANRGAGEIRPPVFLGKWPAT